MVVYNIISFICLIFILAILITILIRMISYERFERINYIRNFKKGQCSIIYFIAIPLYVISNLYNGSKFIDAFFDAISKAIYLIALKFDTSYVANLASASLLYKITVLLCISLVVLNAMMLTLSICHQSIWRYFKHLFFMLGRKSKCIIIGNNKESISIYKSCKSKKIIVDGLSKDQKEKLFMQNICYKSIKQKKFLFEWIFKRAKKIIKGFKKEDKKINVIINCNNEKDNLFYCGQFVDFINKNDDCVGFIELYVFGDREYEDIYSKYENNAKGALHYINEYKQIAFDFVDRFPLTEYMDENHIDYENATIKSDVNINVSMIGFGRTNQQIFTAMLANNQFLSLEEGKGLIAKKVNYHLFDRLHKEGHKNLNHNCHRYQRTFYADGKIKVNEDEYLPLPDLLANEKYHYLDINDIEFYDDLKNTMNFNSKSINYIIVSLGEDFANIDICNKIVTKLKEWKAQNCYIFARVKDKNILSNAQIFLDLNLCHPFGTDSDVVYAYNKIVQEKFSKMAMLKHYVYNVENDFEHSEITKLEEEKSRQDWYTKLNSVQRDSNIYACLSIKNKLHLLGLNYIEKDTEYTALTNQEYLDIYAINDMPNIGFSDNKIKVIKYGIDYKDSKRKKLAIQEHLRWNAFMIQMGFIPATKEQILNEIGKNGSYTNGKNFEMRHHGNLTTFEGLVEFRKLISQRDKKSEIKTDVIKYDFELLDGLYWLLDKCGFKIIKK